jgi:hypothetical protein
MVGRNALPFTFDLLPMFRIGASHLAVQVHKSQIIKAALKWLTYTSWNYQYYELGPKDSSTLCDSSEYL